MPGAFSLVAGAAQGEPLRTPHPKEIQRAEQAEEQSVLFHQERESEQEAAGQESCSCCCQGASRLQGFEQNKDSSERKESYKMRCMSGQPQYQWAQRQERKRHGCGNARRLVQQPPAKEEHE